MHFVFYLGDYPRMRASLRIWWAFARNPGGEPAFWDHVINTFIVGYNYRYFLAFSGTILALALTALPLKHRRRPDIWLVTLYCSTAVLACMFSLPSAPEDRRCSIRQ